MLGVVPFVRYEEPGGSVGRDARGGSRERGRSIRGFPDVEPLIGLQDELNTRLSDRAFRVTMTCFRMYLGRGSEEFTKRPCGSGADVVDGQHGAHEHTGVWRGCVRRRARIRTSTRFGR